MISSSTAAEVARGVSRLLIQEGYSPILEFTLPNGRRLDVAAIGPGGEMLGVEIKVALADLRGDSKWPEYLDYCDLFYFAIPPDFPHEHVPQAPGLIVADRYGGAIIKEAQAQALHASRRKAVTVSFARAACSCMKTSCAVRNSRSPCSVRMRPRAWRWNSETDNSCSSALT